MQSRVCIVIALVMSAFTVFPGCGNSTAVVTDGATLVSGNRNDVRVGVAGVPVSNVPVSPDTDARYRRGIRDDAREHSAGVLSPREDINSMQVFVTEALTTLRSPAALIETLNHLCETLNNLKLFSRSKVVIDFFAVESDYLEEKLRELKSLKPSSLGGDAGEYELKAHEYKESLIRRYGSQQKTFAVLYAERNLEAYSAEIFAAIAAVHSS